MKEIELNGKTIDEAKQAALDQLGVTEDLVEITIIKKGRTGVLGVGSEEARIRVRILDKSAETDDVKSAAQEILGNLIKEELQGIENLELTAKVRFRVN